MKSSFPARERQLRRFERSALCAWWLAHGERMAADDPDAARVMSLLNGHNECSDTEQVAVWVVGRLARGERLTAGQIAQHAGWGRERAYRLLAACERCLPIMYVDGRGAGYWCALEAFEAEWDT